MSQSVLTVAEAIYGGGERVDFDRSVGRISYGKTEDGYFVFNTGNAVADAVASVFVNEVGIDNFVNSVAAFRGGNVGEGVKQALYGLGQASITLIPGINIIAHGGRATLVAARAARAGGGITRALGSRLLNVPSNARYAIDRAFKQPTLIKGARTLIPRVGSTSRQLRAGRQAGMAPVRTASGYQWTSTAPTAITAPGSLPISPFQIPGLSAGTRSASTIGGAGPTIPLRPAQTRAAIRETFKPVAAAGGAPVWVQRSRYLAGRSPSPGVAGTGAFGAPPLVAAGRAGVGFTGYLGFDIANKIGTSRQEVEAGIAAAAANSEAEAADVVRRNSVQEEIDAAIAEIGPGGSGDKAVADLETDFNSSIGALNFQYDRTVNELRSMYQLSETEDEQRRIRFMLADIEAQADAGRRAIENVYNRKREEVQKLTEASRESSVKAAQKAFDLYTVSAGQLRDMLEADRQNVAQDVAGFGAAAPRDQSEYVQLLSAMAPVASESRQAIGDIGTAGLEWMGATMGEQSAARQGELQRLGMSTRAAAISQHQQAVDKRVNAERMALADAVATLRNRQASEAGALQRAALGQSSDQQTFSPVDVQTIVQQAAMQTGSAARAIEQYRIYFAGKPNPLGGVYPQQPPQFVIDAINQTVTEYRAAMEMTQQENAIAQRELADAASAMGMGGGG